jgi:hypothetical protein
MESFIITAVVLAVICAYQYYREVQEKKEAEEDRFFAQLMAKGENNEKEKSNENKMDGKTMGARDLLMDLLTKLGCQYEVDDKDRINFKWQGGYFSADADNESAFVIVRYFQWAEYELYDIDTISRVKRVINDANIYYNIDVVYSTNEAGSTFNVHSKKHFVLMSQIPDVESYLQAILGMFFEVRRYVETQIDKLKIDEERKNNN